MGKIIVSPLAVDIPPIDVASFLFSSGTPESRRSPTYFDASNPQKCFSLDQAEIRVKRFAHGLQRLNIGPGEKIMVFSNNCLSFPIALWSIIASGCVFTASSPSASVFELELQLRNSDTRLLLVGPGLVDTAIAASSKCGLPMDKIYLFSDPEDGIPRSSMTPLQHWTELWSAPEQVRSWSWKKITTKEESQSTTAILNFSSGTTGLPKGVELSHYNVIANCVQLVHKRSIVANNDTARSRKARIDMSGERWLAPLPMYHAYGQTYYCMNAPRIGAKVFIMSKFSIDLFLQYLDIYRITFLTAVPVVINSLIKRAHPQRYNLKSIEAVVNGSAPLSADLARSFEEIYLRPEVKVKQGLGMTEATCSLIAFAPDDEDDGRSVGWLNANCQAKIMPVEGSDFSRSAPSNFEVGEIWVSGPNIMKGYYKNPEQTANTIVYEDGHRWLRTGDVGYVDERGCFYVVDRLKELIKVKGFQVAPAELELGLQTHPDVADAAVVGVKVDGHECPRAFVVRKDNKVSARELEELIKTRFASYKWITAGIYFIREIPRTASGKIIRRALPTSVKNLEEIAAKL